MGNDNLTHTFSGVVSDSNGPLGLSMAGNFTQVMAGANSYSGPTTVTAGNLIFTAANTSSGIATVSGGTLTLAHQLALQNATLNPSGGTVAFDHSVIGASFTVGGLTGAGNIALQDNAPIPNPIALAVGSNGADNTYSGVLSGPGSLVKQGGGILSLTTSSTYSGPTVIQAGTLKVVGPPTGLVAQFYNGTNFANATGANGASYTLTQYNTLMNALTPGTTTVTTNNGYAGLSSPTGLTATGRSGAFCPPALPTRKTTTCGSRAT